VSALDDALKDIERTFGKGTAFRFSKGQRIPIAAIPTGAITLDRALGIGGVPRGRIVEVFGPESSGKTTLVLEIMAQAQAMGLEVAMLDAEHALDVGYAEALGVNVGRMIFSQPDSAEEALEVATRLVRSGGLGVLVVDSVAALVPRAELAGEVGDAHVGLLARLMGQACRKLAGSASSTGTTVIFVNQIREKVGVLYGSPETQPGGRALKFFASQRLDVRRVSTGSDEHHNRTKVTVKKNKVAPPYKVAEFDIDFGSGISTAGCLIDLADDLGVITRKGGRHGFVDTGELIDVSRDKTKARLNAEPELMAELDSKVRAALGL
jgi:recombination protein RecA